MRDYVMSEVAAVMREHVLGRCTDIEMHYQVAQLTGNVDGCKRLVAFAKGALASPLFTASQKAVFRRFLEDRSWRSVVSRQKESAT